MNITVKYYFQCFSDLKISVQIIPKKKNYQFDGCRKNKLIFMFHTYSSLQILTLADFTYPEFNMIYYLFITYAFLVNVVYSI